MKNHRRVVVFFILIFSVYHLIRDILQAMNLDNPLTDIFHWDHQWCGKYCDYVTFPFDILGIAASVYIIKRKKWEYAPVFSVVIFFIWSIAILTK